MYGETVQASVTIRETVFPFVQVVMLPKHVGLTSLQHVHDPFLSEESLCLALQCS